MQPPVITPADILEFERELYKRSFSEFVKAAWHVLEPGQPYVHNWHADAIAMHLESIVSGEIKRLLINVPPGTSKSSLVNIFFPAWQWGPLGMAHTRFISAAHEQGLSIRDNRKMRMLVQSEWFQRRWPLELSGDQNAKLYFENTERGFRQACSIESMTGRRGDCLTFDAIISTDIGDLTIKEIVDKGGNCNVLSIELNSGELVYRPVQAVARSLSSEIYRVHTASGSVVECTGDHRIYTDRGFVPASVLSKGDVLLQILREGGCQERLPNKESGEEGEIWGFLQPKLLREAHQRNGRKDRSELQYMRNKNGDESKPAVLGRVPGESCVLLERKGSVKNTGNRVQALREDVSAKVWAKQQSVLCSMHESTARERYEGGEQPNVARGRGCEEVRLAEFEAVQESKDKNTRQGRESVRVLRREVETACSPYGYGYLEQRVEESGDAVHIMPYQMASPKEIGTAKTTVTLVERVSKSEMVYDIQVEETRCFFANGILVHNCVIIDDPHSATGALSDQKRQTTLTEFRETVPSRLNNPADSAIIVIMQRLHEGDVAGHILEHEHDYVHLCLPMEYERERHCKTRIGFSDPRTKEGELLFPERFPADVVEGYKRTMGEYAYASQMQQRPAPRTGGFFKWERFEIVKVAQTSRRMVRYWDKAGTEGGGARTAGVLMSVSDDGVYYIHGVIKGQWSALERERVIRQTAETDGKRVDIWIEQEPGSGGKESAEATIRNLAGYKIKAERPTGEKAVRAEPYSAQVEAGNIKLVSGDWNKDFIDEHKTFPVGKYKDQIDAAAGAFNKLAVPAYNIFGLV